jgi:hypothetical protein
LKRSVGEFIDLLPPAVFAVRKELGLKIDEGSYRKLLEKAKTTLFEQLDGLH